MENPWTQEAAIELCRKIEAFAPNYNLHVALTGGLLYKDGPRKDCDIVLYRVRHEPANWAGLWTEAKEHGLVCVEDFGWCKKCRYEGKPVDIFDPDEDGDYSDDSTGSLQNLLDMSADAHKLLELGQ